MIIPTNLGNPQASDIAVEQPLPMTGSSSREDGQTTLILNDAEVAKLYEDRNLTLTQGGLISFSGSVLTFTEQMYLAVNSQVAGGAPTLIPLFAGVAPYTAQVLTTGDMIYAVINRILGTAVITQNASSLPAVNAGNQEVWMIGRRDDALDGTMRFYFREGTAINAGQTIRLGAPSGIAIPAALVEMFGGGTPPPGYLLCDGSAYLVADYPGLSSALYDSSTATYAYGNPPATYAFFTGVIAGTSTSVTLDAVTPGTGGNSILLTFSNGIAAESLTYNATALSDESTRWWSQEFLTTQAGVVQSADLYLSYAGIAPTGNLYAQIYTSSGGTPGTLLATSNPVDSATLTNIPAQYSFSFAPGSTVDLANATEYCVVLNTSGVTYTLSSTFIYLSIDNTGPYIGQTLSQTVNSGGFWGADPGNSAYFIVNVAPSINDEIAVWNAANPSNQVMLASGDGTQVPSNGASAQLAGGLNAGDQFNVPDFRGYGPRGVDAGAGNDPDSSTRFALHAGGNVGDNIGSYQYDAQMDHYHYMTPYTGNTGSNTGSPPITYPAYVLIQNPGARYTANAYPYYSPGTISTENRGKNLYVNFIIKF